ncbi:MAG: hypothetical protein ACYCVB_03070 [Bacilli bacterium]
MKHKVGLMGIIAAGAVFAQISTPTLAHADHASASTTLSAEVHKMIPSGSVIIPEGANKTPFLSVDMNHNDQFEYVALYKYKKHGIPLVGAMIFNHRNGHVQKLWQYTGSDVVMPARISVKDLLNNGKKEVIFQGEIGAMANYNEILADNNGHIRPIFNSAAYRLDIGDFNGRGINELATWTQNFGDLYNIRMYGWNKSRGQYQQVPNNKSPRYFKNTVIPYYNALAKTKYGKMMPKVNDYALAMAYYDAGQYKQALTEIAGGLKISNNDYPPDSEFLALKKQITRSK